MKLLNVFFIIFLISFLSIAGEDNNFPKTFKSGDLAISITANGLIDLKYKDSALLTVQNVWFMNEKWQALPRKDGDVMSVESVNQADSAVTIRIDDKRGDFMKSFKQQIVLTNEGLSTSVDYEYAADIGQWHWPVYLYAQYFTGVKYKSLLADGSTKEGTVSEVIPDKVIYGIDGNKDLKEITFSLVNADVKLTFSNGAAFCDHRGAPWMKTKVFMMLSNTSCKKKDAREHYELKISVTPKK